jgi:hypothetical protein
MSLWRTYEGVEEYQSLGDFKGIGERLRENGVEEEEDPSDDLEGVSERASANGVEGYHSLDDLERIAVCECACEGR